MRHLGHYSSGYMKLLSAIQSNGGVECEDYQALFFPEDIPDYDYREAAIEAAKILCNRCPIKKICFEYALETNQEYGIWGCTSADERAI